MGHQETAGLTLLGGAPHPAATRGEGSCGRQRAAPSWPQARLSDGTPPRRPDRAGQPGGHTPLRPWSRGPGFLSQQQARLQDCECRLGHLMPGSWGDGLRGQPLTSAALGDPPGLRGSSGPGGFSREPPAPCPVRSMGQGLGLWCWGAHLGRREPPSSRPTLPPPQCPVHARSSSVTLGVPTPWRQHHCGPGAGRGDASLGAPWGPRALRGFQ